ncbi:MAG TPA: type VII secretion-associated serine protease mycosin [Mycobacterium sp.]|nr:type VII secretion-associated serine protease mycosin [Mycobacterium sp.]
MTLPGARTVAVIGLSFVAAAQCAPPAFAVAPPPVDDRMLPAPARPAPPTATIQQEPCTTPVDAGAGNPVQHRRNGVDLQQVWRLTRGAGQRVAVIDTGVQPHPRLPSVVSGGDYVSTGDGTQDCDGHGTLVAGIIGAAPGDRDGFAGVAPEVTLIGIRQSSIKFGPADTPSSRGIGDVTTLAMAVRTAADLGASVINISSVACAESTFDDRALGAALSYAVDVKDAVVVAAAGNVGGAGQCPAQNTGSRPAVIASPAWYDDYVLAVGSVNDAGAPSPFSLNGPWVDVAAPGEGVVSLDRAGPGLVDSMPGPTGSAPISGTSYAAPVVSALAALVRSRFPRMSARQVMTRIENTAHKPAAGWDPAVGNGVVDLLAAVGDQVPAVAAPKGKAVEPPRHVEPDDRHTGTVAVSGAAACLAGLVAIAAFPRLRRRPVGADVAGD